MINHPNRSKKFHEGRDVEVLVRKSHGKVWRKAKILAPICIMRGPNNPATQWQVAFPDGTRAIFDAGHIRAFISEAQIAHYIKRLGDQDKADCIE
jgi:hypothetical protein